MFSLNRSNSPGSIPVILQHLHTPFLFLFFFFAQSLSLSLSSSFHLFALFTSASFTFLHCADVILTVKDCKKKKKTVNWLTERTKLYS